MDSEIGSKDELVIVDKNGLNAVRYIFRKMDTDRAIITYLETLFEPDEKLAYVTESCNMTKVFAVKRLLDKRRSLIKELYQCKGHIGSVLGDYNSEVGA